VFCEDIIGISLGSDAHSEDTVKQNSLCGGAHVVMLSIYAKGDIAGERVGAESRCVGRGAVRQVHGRGRPGGPVHIEKCEYNRAYTTLYPIRNGVLEVYQSV
jgi:hypothetical protein